MIYLKYTIILLQLNDCVFLYIKQKMTFIQGRRNENKIHKGNKT